MHQYNSGMLKLFGSFFHFVLVTLFFVYDSKGSNM